VFDFDYVVAPSTGASVALGAFVSTIVANLVIAGDATRSDSQPWGVPRHFSDLNVFNSDVLNSTPDEQPHVSELVPGSNTPATPFQESRDCRKVIGGDVDGVAAVLQDVENCQHLCYGASLAIVFCDASPVSVHKAMPNFGKPTRSR
jgi:hypothetical protein